MDTDESQHEPTNRKKLKTQTKVALWLLLGPTILIFVGFILFGVSNLAFGTIPDTLPAACSTDDAASQIVTNPSQECQEELIGSQPPISMFINVVLFISIALGVLAWLPGLIIGIILLVRPKPATP